jgi:hypothetical protein
MNKRATLAASILATCQVIPIGCHRAEEQPIVVHVFRDPTASQVNSALVGLGQMDLRISGRPILIATVEPTSYSAGLTDIGRQTHPEVIIFDSSDDLSKVNVGASILIPAVLTISGTRYYVVIPAWASGETRGAAELVVNKLLRYAISIP